MLIGIKFRAEYNSVPPICTIRTKKTSHTITLSKTDMFEQDFYVEETDVLEIEFTNKDGQDDNVVHIDSISIDEINQQHYIYQGVFYPQYDREWLESQTQPPPAQYSPCTELRLKGVWKYNIKTPIWKMLMEKWLNDDR